MSVGVTRTTSTELRYVVECYQYLNCFVTADPPAKLFDWVPISRRLDHGEANKLLTTLRSTYPNEQYRLVQLAIETSIIKTVLA